jgi:hypothetical protein
MTDADRVKALRDLIAFDALPTLLIFAPDNAGVRAVIEKIDTTLAALDEPVTGERPGSVPCGCYMDHAGKMVVLDCTQGHEAYDTNEPVTGEPPEEWAAYHRFRRVGGQETTP